MLVTGSVKKAISATVHIAGSALLSILRGPTRKGPMAQATNIHIRPWYSTARHVGS